MKRIVYFLLSLVLIMTVTLTQKAEGGTMKISSPEFKHNTLIPKKFTCQGQDLNPKLIIEGVPQGGPLSPILSTVSIIPGIETRAPDRTETRSGFSLSPKPFPITCSTLVRFDSTAASSPFAY